MRPLQSSETVSARIRVSSDAGVTRVRVESEQLASNICRMSMIPPRLIELEVTCIESNFLWIYLRFTKIVRIFGNWYPKTGSRISGHHRLIVSDRQAPKLGILNDKASHVVEDHVTI